MTRTAPPPAAARPPVASRPAPPAGRALRAVSDWLDLQDQLLSRSLRAVAPRARGRLLDVGCGGRRREPLFAPYAQQYLGIECDATFALTSASLDGSGPDLLYDGEHLPFADGSFDTVLSIEVLEHTPRPGRLVAEMARILRGGGVLVLAAPFSQRLHEEPHDYFRYTPQGLRALCARAGLRVVDTRRHGSVWSVVAHKLNSYLALRTLRAGRIAQALGKLGHEPPAERGARLWALPFVVPLMAALTAVGRLLDRALPDPTEALGFLVLAEKRGPVPRACPQTPRHARPRPRILVEERPQAADRRNRT